MKTKSTYPRLIFNYDKSLMSISFILLFFMTLSSNAQTIFSEIQGFEPRFVLPQDEALLIKSIKDYGAVGDGVSDDTHAFQAAMTSGQRFIFIPSGTYLIKDQIRMSSGMKRLFWIGERRSTTILKLADGSPGFGDPNNPKAFIYAIAPGQQGEQNMHNYIQHLTIEIGENNPGAIALNFHTNNTGAVKDVAVRAADPVNHKGFRGITIQDWGAGPGNLRYIEVEGFQTGIYISENNHWTLEHVRISNCNTGLRITSAGSGRAITTINCETGIHVSGPLALMEASVLDGPGTGNAVIVEGSNVMIRDLKTSGYQNAVSAAGYGDGTVAGPDVTKWLSGALRSLWDPQSGMDFTLGLPVEESPEYQYPQTPDKWTLISSTGNITTELQNAIDGGAEFIYLQGSTISSTIYVRNKVKKIMVLGEGAITMNPGSTNPAFVIQYGEPKVVILEHLYENYGSNLSWTIEQASGRTLVYRHGSGTYRSLPEANGGKVFMESVVGGFEFNGVRAWLRDMNTELGGLNALNIHINNSTVWILGQKTEDFATKIKVVNGSYCELLGGTYRQNWDLQRVIDGGIDPDNPVPLYHVENSHASFAAFTTWGWSGEFAYDPVIREIRDEMTRDLSRSAGGGAMPLFVGYSQFPEPLEPVSVTGIEIGCEELTLILGKTELISSGVIPADASNKKILWESDTPSVAEVDASGFVTAIAEGSARITAKSEEGDFSSSCLVTVPEFISVTGISITPAEAVISLEESLQLEFTIEPDNATDKSVIWSTNKPDVVTVDNNGMIKGLATGVAEVSVTSNDNSISAISMITVVRPSATGLYAYEGFDYQEGVLTGLNGGTGWAGAWTGDGTIRAPGLGYSNCESTGNLVGIANQSATREISKTLGGSGKVIWMGFILSEVANSSIIKFELLEDDTIRMAFFRGPYDQWGINSDGTGDPDNLPWFNEKSTHHFWLFKMVFGTTHTNITVWRDPNLASEPESGGATVSIPTFSFNKVQILTSFPGNPTETLFDEIRIAGNFLNAKSNILYVPVEEIFLEPAELNLNLGQTFQLNADILPSDASNKAVSWSSENPLIASVNNNGWVTGTGNGSTVITATTTDGGFTATTSVNVTVPVSSVGLSPEELILHVGESQQLVAIVLPENSTNKNLNWSSNDLSVATVSNEGLVEAIGAGMAEIRVTTEDGNHTSVCDLTVNVGISVGNENINQYLVYPNPTKGKIHVEMPGEAQYFEIHIYNHLGIQIRNASFSNTLNATIDISDYPAGFYFVRVKHRDQVSVNPVVLIK